MLKQDVVRETSPRGRFTSAWWLWRRFSLRRVLRNPLRVLALVLSVALATTLLSAVVKVSFASVSSFEQSLGFGKTPDGVFVSPVGGRLQINQIARCFSGLSVYASIIAFRRESGVLHGNGASQVVSVAGITGYGATVGALYGASSRWELSPTVRKQLGLAAGDRASLEVAGEKIDFVVPELSGRLLHGEMVDVTAPFESLAGEPFVDSVVLTPRKGAGATFAQDVAGHLTSCLGNTLGVRVESYEQPLKRSAQLLAAYRMNILIMAGITLLVCGLLISQATHVAVRVELRELSILRSLGISQLGCFGMIVFEGAFLSLLGALVGCSVGYPIAVWLTGFLINTAHEIYQVSIVPFGVGYSITQGLLAIIGIAAWGAVSSACAARSVLTLAPYRGTRREQIHNEPLVLRTAFLSAGAGVLICSGALVLAERIGGTLLAYCSVAAVLIGAICVTPLGIVAAARYIPLRAQSIAVRLAGSSLRTAGRHFVLSGVAASLAIALMVGLSLMVSSFHGTLSGWSATRLAGDLFVSAALSGNGNEGRIDPRYVAQIRAYPAFAAVVPYYETNSEIDARSGVVVGGTPLALQCLRSVYTFVQGGCEGSGWEHSALISESAARKLGLGLGAGFLLDGIRLSVRGIVQEFGTESPLVIIDEQVFRNLYPSHHPKTITLDLHNDYEHDQVRTWLDGIAPRLLVIRDSGELRALVDTLFTRTFRVTEGVRWIVFTLAILGLVSTGAQYVWERRREFKTASVLGVSSHLMALSVGLEAGSVAVAALIIGVGAGIAIGWCLTMYINPQVFGWSLDYDLFSARPFIEASMLPLGVFGLCVLIAHSLVRVIERSVRMADE